MAVSLSEQRRIVFDQIAAAERTGMPKEQADELRAKVDGATIGQLIEAASVGVIDGSFLSRVPVPKMQGAEETRRAGERIEGIGRKTRVRTPLDVSAVQAHFDAHMTELIKSGAALFYGQAFSGAEVEKRAEGFIAPKAVEAAWLSERKGLEARVMVYQANIQTKPYYILFSNEGGMAKEWKVDVYSKSGEVVANARAKPDGKEGVTFSWTAAQQ